MFPCSQKGLLGQAEAQESAEFTLLKHRAPKLICRVVPGAASGAPGRSPSKYPRSPTRKPTTT
jgi:hypothetical protein